MCLVIKPKIPLALSPESIALNTIKNYSKAHYMQKFGFYRYAKLQM